MNNSINPYNEYELYSVFDELLDGVIVINDQKLVVYCNKEFNNIIGVSNKRSPIGEAIFDIIKVTDETHYFSKEITWDKLNTNIYKEITFSCGKNEEEHAFILIKEDNLYKGSEKRFIAFFRSSTLEVTLQNKYKNELKQKVNAIADLKAAQEKLESYTRNLEQIVEYRTDELKKSHNQVVYQRKMLALSEVTRGMIHEINNPLTIIKGMADRLFKNFKSKNLINEDSNGTFQKIYKMIDRISLILQGLKSFSAEEPGMVTKERVNITQMLEDTLVKLYDEFNKANIKILNKCSEDHLFVEVNRTHVQRAISNILMNSIEALSNSDQKEIEISCLLRDQSVEIKISDNGPGINEDIKDKIFQPFFTTNKNFDKIGLGLSEAKGIIEKYNGTLLLHNSEIGTTLIIEFPRMV